MRLDDDQLDELAERIAAKMSAGSERIAEQASARTLRLLSPRLDALGERFSEAADAEAQPRLLDARELARVLGVSRSWVYEHSTELEPVRLGGENGRLRFDRETAIGRYGSLRSQPETPAVEPDPPPARARHRSLARNRQESAPAGNGDVLVSRPRKQKGSR